MQRQLARINPMPNELSSPEAKLVYLYLDAADGATTDELSETLTMKKMSVLSVLDSLASEGHVERHGSAYVLAH